MFAAILKFELRRQLRSPLFWIVAIAFALLAFAFVTTDAISIGGGMGNVHRNAPIVIIRLLAVFSILSMFLVTIFVAGAILRDFDQRTAEMMFATPVSKGAYLGGRFVAGFVIALAVMVATAIGMLIGSFMPWLEAARLGSTSLAAYGWAFGVIVLPDMLLIAAFLFLIASLTRSMLKTYIGLIVLFVLQAVAGSLMRNLFQHSTAALLDPFGGSAIRLVTRYWSVAQQNTRLPELSGLLLANRAIWLGVAIALLALTWYLFRPNREGLRWWRRRKRILAAPSEIAHFGAPLALPKVSARDDWRAHWVQYLASARRYTASVLRGVPFLIMLLLGVANLVGGLILTGKIYGAPVYPLTHIMLRSISGSFEFLLWIILIFYAGELVWRERGLRTSEVSDAMPSPNWVTLASKLSALIGVIVAFLIVGVLCTIGWQLAHGFTHLQPLLYVKGLALDAIPMVLIAVLAVFLQVLANSKFLGYLLIILVLAGKLTLALMHHESNLYSYASAPGIPYSDLYGYAYFWIGALWFYGYWAWFALGLLVATVLLWVRGTGHTWASRRRAVRGRFTRPVQITLAVAVIGFIAFGGWIYYNTMVLNEYVPSNVARQRRATYEKTYAKYANFPQPRITAVKAKVDLYPHQRRLHIDGHYTLVNKHDAPIDVLHMRLNAFRPVTHLTLDSLKMPPHTVLKTDPIQGVVFYKLDNPLAPGQSMNFDFQITWAPQGFTNGTGETALVGNGSFVHNGGLFPQFGYSRGRQLTSKSKRRKFGLDPDKPIMPALSEDPAKRANTYISHDADWIKFQTTVCTAGDQLAMAPGHLTKKWTTDNGRNCFHYQMDQPMLNFFAYWSGRYAVKKADWHGIKIAVYYDPDHPWNVDHIIQAVKKGLAYYNSQYTPYQFDQVRVLEFPGYAAFAQSFPNTIAYSEAIGFTTDLRGKDTIDFVTEVTAHELAHQWWAHRVIGADMQGATMLSESLAQYSSLMVMQHLDGKQQMRQFLKYELDSYLRGRTVERNRENPLAKVEGQGYIRYRKGGLVFYALQDYIGEHKLNAMLKQFLIATGFQQPPYTNTIEFMHALDKAAGPQWHNVLQDWFWKITLYDNRVESATAKKAAGGGWDVTMKVHTGKTYADGKGHETKAKFDIPVDIGVFAKAKDGKEKDEPVLYLKQRRIGDGDQTLTIHVDAKPYEAGIDPYNKLIDRVSSDNRMPVTIH